MSTVPGGLDPYAPPEARGPDASDFGAPAPLRIDGAFGRAFEVMKRFLFRPFDFGKLFVYAFIVWLAELGEGGGGNYAQANPFGGGGGRGAGSKAFRTMHESARDWIHDNLGMVIALGIGAFVLTVGFAILLAWLSSRGHLMALRAVALDHARLAEHWRETREAAWSYLGFRLLLALVETPVWIAVLVWAYVSVVDALDLGTSDPMVFVHALMGPILVVLVISLAMAPIHFLGRNMLAPMLLKFGDGLRANWARTMSVVRTSLGGVVVFMLVRIVIAAVQGMAETMLVYVTCCIGALPVLHQIVSAPFSVFERAYAMAVLESLGPDYKLMIDPAPWPPPYPPMPAYPQQYGQPPRYTPPPGYGQ